MKEISRDRASQSEFEISQARLGTLVSSGSAAELLLLLARRPQARWWRKKKKKKTGDGGRPLAVSF